MSSTPTKAEKEQGIKVYEFKWTNEPEKPRLQLIDIEDHLKAMDALEERLRLAEEYSDKLFKAAVKYASSNRVDDYQAMCDLIADRNLPDCELQKILGKEKGHL